MAAQSHIDAKSKLLDLHILPPLTNLAGITCWLTLLLSLVSCNISIVFWFSADLCNKMACAFVADGVSYNVSENKTG